MSAYDSTCHTRTHTHTHTHAHTHAQRERERERERERLLTTTICILLISLSLGAHGRLPPIPTSQVSLTTPGVLSTWEQRSVNDSGTPKDKPVLPVGTRETKGKWAFQTACWRDARCLAKDPTPGHAQHGRGSNSGPHAKPISPPGPHAKPSVNANILVCGRRPHTPVTHSMCIRCLSHVLPPLSRSVHAASSASSSKSPSEPTMTSCYRRCTSFDGATARIPQCGGSWPRRSVRCRHGQTGSSQRSFILTRRRSHR